MQSYIITYLNAERHLLEYYSVKIGKLKLEMRLVHVVEKSPHKKIKLDPISEE